MDKFSDFFKDLKERISSPLISSFIFSWIIFNWQIVIAIFKFEVKGFSLKDYMSYTDYVCSLINYNNCFWHPLYVALFYTFLYPFLRNGIQIADAWFKGWGNNFKLTVSKTNKISIEKYIQLREIYQKRSQLLESVLDKESVTIKKNEELVNQISELKNNANSLQSELISKTEIISQLEMRLVLLQQKVDSNEIWLSKYREKEDAEKDYRRVEILNGVWNLSQKINNNNEVNPIESKLRFLDGKVYNIGENGIETKRFDITSYDYNPVNKHITINTNLTINGSNQFYTLIPNDDFTILKGIISMSPIIDVTFTKELKLENHLSA